MTITKNVLFTNNITKHMSDTKTHPLTKTCPLPQTCQSQIYLYLKLHMGENILKTIYWVPLLTFQNFQESHLSPLEQKLNLFIFSKRVQKKSDQGGSLVITDDHRRKVKIYFPKKVSEFFEHVLLTRFSCRQ